jgi:secondary thiamine-phosphate synthase enzyme
MKIMHKVLPIQSKMQVTFDDVTDQVKQFIKESGVQNGIVTVFSQHTSCSVFIQEDSEGTTYKGIPYILQDTLNCLEKIIPTCEYEGQYLHPCVNHIERAQELRGEEKLWGLNTDGHIKSSVLGRSETIPVVDGEMTLGEFGRIYFADFDKTRARERQVRIHIMGE